MYYETDQRRFVLVLGERADRLIDDPTVRILDRRDGVVLAETSYWTAAELRHRADVTTHSYEREGEARLVFGLFDQPSLALRDPE